MLYFITGNKNKIAIAEKFLKPFGIIFEPKDLNIEEIQSDNIEKVAMHKAKNAYSKVKKPLIVTDHFWSIPALGGFPGAYMKYINQWFTPDDVLNLMKNKNDRKAILTEMICYIDEKTIKTFSGTHEGKVLQKQQGGGLATQTVISLSEDGISIAKKLENNPSALDKGTVWEDFAKWYKDNK